MRTNILKSFKASKVPALESICRWIEVTREPLSAFKFRLKESEVRDFMCAPEYKNISDPPTRSKRSLHDINVSVNTGLGNQVMTRSPVELFEEEPGEITHGSPKKSNSQHSAKKTCCQLSSNNKASSDKVDNVATK